MQNNECPLCGLESRYGLHTYCVNKEGFIDSSAIMLPFLYTGGDEMKTIKVDGDSEEEARIQVKNQIPEDFYIFREETSGGEYRYIIRTGENIEDTLADARSAVPSGVSDLNEEVLFAPCTKELTVKARDPESAEHIAKLELLEDESLKRVYEITGILPDIEGAKLKSEGKKGFLGMGRQPNCYDVRVVQSAAVQIRYKEKVTLQATIGKLNEIVKEYNNQNLVAGETLEKAGDKAIPLIVKRIQSEPVNASDLIEVLTRIADEQVIPVLLKPEVFLCVQVLASQGDYHIVDFIARCGNQESVPQLMRYFEQFVAEGDRLHAGYVARGLGVLASPKAEDLLLNALINNEDVFTTYLEKALTDANNEYSKNILNKWKQKRSEMGIIEYGACPKCGRELQTIEGSDMSPHIDRYVCPKCRWTGLRCGSGPCPGYLEIEEILSSGNYRYTCKKCGWTGLGIPSRFVE